MGQDPHPTIRLVSDHPVLPCDSHSSTVGTTASGDMSLPPETSERAVISKIAFPRLAGPHVSKTESYPDGKDHI
jgi:hypothetical protein